MRADSLTHITSDGKWFNTAHDASLQRLVREMDIAKIDKSVVAGLGLADDVAISEAVKKHPNRLYPVGWLDIGTSFDTIDQRVDCLVRDGFKGIKIHPRISKTPLESEAAKYAVKLAAKNRLSVFLCTIHRPELPPLARPLSADIHELCLLNTETPMILLHGGYTELLSVSEIIRPFENVLLDLSMTYPRFRSSSIGLDIHWLTKAFDKRITFGSDFPERSFRDVLQALEEDGYDIKRLERLGMLGKNLAHILNF